MTPQCREAFKYCIIKNQTPPLLNVLLHLGRWDYLPYCTKKGLSSLKTQTKHKNHSKTTHHPLQTYSTTFTLKKVQTNAKKTSPLSAQEAAISATFETLFKLLASKANISLGMNHKNSFNLK